MYNTYKNRIDQRLAVSSPLDLDFKYRVLSSSKGVIFGTITADASVSGGDNIVHLAIVQAGVAGKPYVARDFFDIQNLGVTSAGESETIAFSFDLDPAWDTPNLRFLVLVQDHASKEVLQASQAETAGPVDRGIVVGAGPGPNATNMVKVFTPDTGELLTAFSAYNPNRFGTNVGVGKLHALRDPLILTGPGPGPIFGPQVRAFEGTGQPFENNAVNFLAYGTKKFGVKVAGANITGGGADEILTGPGPGAVFGPHIRGFQYANGTVTPINPVSFFAYGTKKWGANVAGGDIDNDGFDEIITGPGPGSVFGPHVRAFNYDNSGSTPTPVPGVSFIAYGTKQWGANVAVGDLNNDGRDDILTAPGPGGVFGPHIRGFQYNGATVQPMGGVSFFAYNQNSFRYGAVAFIGNVDGTGNAEIITVPGPGEGYPATVRVWDVNGSTTLRDEFTAFNVLENTYSGRVAFGDF